MGATQRAEVFAKDPVGCEFLLELFRAIVERQTVVRASGPIRPAHKILRNSGALLLPLGDGSVGMILIKQNFS